MTVGKGRLVSLLYLTVQTLLAVKMEPDIRYSSNQAEKSTVWKLDNE